MLLLPRFLLAMFASVLRKRLGTLDESQVTFTALPTDCDLNFHLNAGRFVSFMDIARIELIGRMRLIRRMLARGWRPVMGGIVVRYRKSVLPFERFTIRTRLVGWDERWFYLEHIVEKRNAQKGDSEFCAIAHARTVIRSKEGTIPPRDVLAMMDIAETNSPPLPAFVEQWRASEDAR